ncbi:hypothetical protein BaRGS_00006575 [Batillaria attramentaria]|uniref:MAM domain-containing protein n=1 Tax=Batillaria attramentaria TaxID=370345 RepID=A0ABD0LRU6_9CAEN
MAFTHCFADTVVPCLLWTVLTVWLSGCSQAALVQHCDFEDDLCNWTQPDWADGSWTRHRLGTDTANTGPQSAMPGAGGEYYIYLEASDDAFKNADSSVQPNRTVVLLTPQLTHVECVAFLYMKFGAQVGSLRVGSYRNNAKDVILWEEDGQTDQTWQCASTNTILDNTRIYFEATTGESILGDIALDSVFIFSAPCPTEQNCMDFLNVSAQAPPPVTDSTTPVVITSRTGNGSSPASSSFMTSVSSMTPLVTTESAEGKHLASREKRLRESTMSMANVDNEHYDVLDESAMSSRDAKQHSGDSQSDPYDVITEDGPQENSYRGLKSH